MGRHPPGRASAAAPSCWAVCSSGRCRPSCCLQPATGDEMARLGDSCPAGACHSTSISPRHMRQPSSTSQAQHPAHLHHCCDQWVQRLQAHTHTRQCLRMWEGLVKISVQPATFKANSRRCRSLQTTKEQVACKPTTPPDLQRLHEAVVLVQREPPVPRLGVPLPTRQAAHGGE